MQWTNVCLVVSTKRCGHGYPNQIELNLKWDKINFKLKKTTNSRRQQRLGVTEWERRFTFMWRSVWSERVTEINCVLLYLKLDNNVRKKAKYKLMDRNKKEKCKAKERKKKLTTQNEPSEPFVPLYIRIVCCDFQSPLQNGWHMKSSASQFIEWLQKRFSLWSISKLSGQLISVCLVNVCI